MKNEKVITSYINQLTGKVLLKIDNDLECKSAEFLFQEHFIRRIGKEKNKRNQFLKFHKYYFDTLKNIDAIDFKVFKQRYSLQGVDSAYLQRLNDKKGEIRHFIDADDLSQLYFDFFESAEIKNKNGIREKTLGSFFTKLVHTLKPEDYTPVDIPMKNYFGFEKDSYMIAMIVISKAFKIWSDKNKGTIDEFKSQMCDYMKTNFNIIIEKKVITDIKVMNTIYWSIANPIKN